LSILRALFPAQVRVAEMNPLEASPDCLYPEEAAQIAAAIPERRREYAAGRWLARTVLRGLGCADRPLLNGPDRAPIWPEDIRGSITHTSSWAAVAVARASDVGSLGCDVERDTPLEPSLWDYVLARSERADLDVLPRSERGLVAKLMFSAKESCYKAQFAQSRKFMDFSDLRLELSEAAMSFTGTFRRDVYPFPLGHTLVGRFQRRHGLVATAVLLPPCEDRDPDRRHRG